MEKSDFDLIVLGGGSAGRYAARAAARQGARVGLVEQGPFGGLCILKGCMPTKALLRSSEIVGILRKAPEVGIYPGRRVGIGFSRMMRRKDRLISEMADDALQGVLRDPQITLIDGRAAFLSPEAVRIGSETYRAPRFVIATGSREQIPDVEGLVETGYLISDDLLELKELPRSVVVAGGGAEGVEFGQFLARMGVKVTLLQRSDRILSDEDPEIAEAMSAFLIRDGIDLRCGTRLVCAVRRRGKKRIVYEDRGSQRHEVAADEILIVTGRTGNVDGLDLPRAGVTTDAQGVVVNPYLQTSQPGIFAAGDVIGRLLIVNLATYQGEIAGRNAVSEEMTPVDERVIPRALFTDPEFARVGLSEGEARGKGLRIRVGKLPFSELGKALVSDRAEGFIKLITDAERGEILGAAIVGPEASIIIHQAAVAMYFRATLADYAKISHIHPSLAEIMLYLVEEMVENPSPAPSSI